jgi:hypothetical protein
MVMTVDEVALAGIDSPLALHPRLTIVGDLGAADRRSLADRLLAAIAGDLSATVRWTDPLGEHRSADQDADMQPKAFEIDAEELRAEPTPDRLLALLGRARQADTRGVQSLAIMLDPFAGLAIMRIWELLSITERVSNRVQVLLLTDDEVTLAWAAHRAQTGSLDLVRYWGAQT